MAIVRRFCVLALSLVTTLVLHAQVGLPTLSQQIPSQILNRGHVDLDLRSYFGVPGVTGQVVQFSTSLGRINVELRPTEAPRHVANFLNYVSKNAYDNTLIHRVSNLGATVPAIVQGGGYLAAPIPPVPPSIARSSAVAAEDRVPNTRGTLAAARDSNDPNSATSEWLFNTIDNTTTLGGGGYSVFGRVLGTGMTVVDALAAVPTVNLTGTPFTEFPVRNLTATQTSLTAVNEVIVGTVRVIPIYPAETGDPTSVLSFVPTTSAPGIVLLTITGSTLRITPLAVGTVNVAIRAVDANGNSSITSTFSVTVPQGALLPPLFLTQPVSQTVAAGTTVVFHANATGGESGVFPVQYQWLWNGAPFPAPDSPILIVRSASPEAAGTYSCIATNASKVETLSSAATLTVVSAKAFEVGRLINLAIRTNAGILDDTLIVGFAVGGLGTTGAKPLLIRGVGPSLTQFGVTDVLLDPVLTLYQGRTTIAQNDNWLGDQQISARSTQVGAFGLAAPSALDAAFANSQPSGAYTVQVKDRVDRTGTALVEIYDATAAETIVETTPRLINASARAKVTANSLLIAGFVIGGQTPVTVLIRAVGPTLSGFGVTNALADPKLQLFTGTTFVRENDDWGGEPQLAAISSSAGAFSLSGASSKDATILATLAPGSYTAQVRGTGIVRTSTDDEGNVTVLEDGGVALIEVYEIR